MNAINLEVVGCTVCAATDRKSWSFGSLPIMEPFRTSGLIIQFIF